MKRRSVIHLIGITGVVSSLLSADDEFTFHNDVRLVLLDVAVRSHGGQLVSGLSRGNFQVFEEGHPQAISVFDNQDAPVTMGLLVDESASMTPRRREVLAAADDLIEQSNRADELFVLNFNDTVQPGLPLNVRFSDDPSELHSALNRGYPEGRTALYDAIVDGLKTLERGTRGRRTLVLITDGGDTASRHKRMDAINMLERSNATVFTVGIFDEDAYEVDLSLLRQLAHISGGEAFFPKTNEIMGVCQHIAKEIRTRYTLGYVPSDDPKLPESRHIRVKVSAPGQSDLTVLTRTTYRYDQSSKKAQQSR